MKELLLKFIQEHTTVSIAIIGGLILTLGVMLAASFSAGLIVAGIVTLIVALARAIARAIDGF